MSSLFLRRAGVLASLVCLPVWAQAQSWVLERVGPGAVTGLSADGRVAVGATNGSFEAFRWTAADGLSKLGRGTQRPLGHRSGNPAISADGQVVSATIVNDDGTQSTAGRWTVGGGWQALGPLPADAGAMDGELSSAYGLSGDGRTVTGLYWRLGQPDGLAHAMQWTAETGVQDLGSAGASSRVDDANADGSVLVGWDEHPQFGNRRATVWVNGVRTVLEDSDWPSEASAVNSTGTIVVGQTADPANNFLMSATMWTREASGWRKQVLGVISGRKNNGFAYPTGVSDDGRVVVGIARLDAGKPTSTGFVWTPSGGMRDAAAWLADQGLSLGPLQVLYSASAVSADGQVLALLSYNRRTGAASSHLARGPMRTR